MASHHNAPDELETREESASLPPAPPPEAPLEVVVLCTTPHGTLPALEAAADFARGLAARFRVVVPQVVPFPLSLTDSPVPVDFTVRRVSRLIDSLQLDARLDVRLCRDKWEMFESALGPSSLVVLPGPLNWWPTATSRLVKRLSAQGHRVVISNLV